MDKAPETTPMKRVGVVLAGGQSRRMGQDKALMTFRDERLVDRAVGKLAQQVDVLLINCPTRPSGLPDHVLHVPDQITGFQGPLAGVHACLSHLSASHLGDHYQLFTVPVDSPFFPMDLVERLGQSPQPVAFAASQGQRHPVFARWPAQALPLLADALAKGRRRIDAVANDLGYGEVSWDLVRHDSTGALGDPFININTLDEFQAAGPQRIHS